MPLVKAGRLVAVLSLHHATPRHWTPAQVGLAEEVAERTWAAVERARAEEALRQSEASLQESDRRKDEFLATLAHELRNPLAPIRNALHLLRVAPDRISADRVHGMLDRQVRSPEQYESAARRIDAGMNAARCLASILDEVEELRDPWLESHLKGYEAEIGKISELAITAGVQGAPDQLADLIGHLDQCALPVLLAQSSGQDVEYREAFGRFERQLCASARNSERA